MTNSLATSILAWLLTYAIHSTLLLTLAWMICKQRRLSARTRDLIWKVALAGGIVTASVQMQAGVRPTGSFSLSSPSLRSVSSRSSENAKDQVVGLPPSETEPTATSVPAADAAPSSFARRPSAASLIVIAWGALALAFASFYLGRRLILVGRLANRRLVTEGPLPAMLDALRADVGYRAAVTLTSVNTISSPVALGWREICLPEAALTQLESDQQRGLLAHELAHLVRHDPIWLYAASLIERVLFFQPLNRIARVELQRNAEYLCDDWAAARTGSGLPLAHCLARVAEWIETSPLGVPVAGMAEQRSLLVTRIARLIDGKRTGSTMSTIAFAATAAVLLATITAAAPGVTAGVIVVPTAPTTVSRHSSPSPQAEQAEDPAVIAALIERLKDTDAGVRRAAASSLGNLKSRAAVSALTEALADRNKEVRAAAAGALGNIEDPAAVPGLSRLLNDDSPEVREHALSALSNFANALTVAQVLPALHDARPSIRAKAAEILEEIGDNAAVAPLVKSLADPSAEVRRATIQALARLGATTAAPSIATAMHDGNAEVRGTALQALRELKAPVADAELLGALHDDSPEVRREALELAKEKPSAALIPVFRKMLDDNDSQVREAAVEALSEVRDPTARAALRDALKSTDPKVRRRAAEALGDRP